MMLNKLRTVRCVASSSDNNPIVNARKKFEKTRSVVAKEHLNKLIIIGTSEVKDIQTFITELDQLHRKEFDSLINKPTSTPTQSPIVTEYVNIFTDDE
jgi:hypothetical protein